MRLRKIMLSAVMTASLLAVSFVAMDLTDSGVLADEVPLDMTPGNTYDLDFTEDSFGNTVTYKMTYTAGKTTDYELVTSGSHKLTIRLQHKTSYGSESVKDYKITDINENNVSFVCPLKAGETYFFRISLKNRDYMYPNPDSFEGPNDVKITFKEYQDTSPVIANFNATDFPDANFRAYIEAKADYFKDGKLTQYEADKITYLDVSNKEIADLTGIKFFDKLTSLWCSNNKLTSLDVSGMKNLTGLQCYGNNLTVLNVNGCPALDTLYCHNNTLSSLDLKDNKKLTVLSCYRNELTSLDLRNNSYLQDLTCSNNKLSSLDVHWCPQLIYLTASNNSAIKTINIKGCAQLQRLDMSYCSLESLDVSGAKNLENLDVDGNNLSKLDLKNNLSLKYLYCDDNNLGNLDLSHCSSLEHVICSETGLTSLNISGLSNLSRLWCDDNNITKLDISDSPNLVFAYHNGTKQENSSNIKYVYEDSTYPKLLIELNVDKKVAITANASAPSEGIEVNSTNFPDQALRDAVAKYFDRDKDGVLSDLEIYNASEISTFGDGLEDLTGIGYFKNLNKISFTAERHLKNVDVSGFKALEELSLSWSIVDLNVKGCTKLTSLSVDDNSGLKSIDLSDCHALKWIDISGARLIESLELSQFPDLRELDVSKMDKLQSIDISDNPYLVKAYLEGIPKKEDGIITYSIGMRYSLTVDEDLEIIYKKPDPTPTATATPTPTAKATVTPTQAPKPSANPTSAAKPTAKPTAKPANNATLTIDKKTATVVCGKSLTLKATLKGSSSKITWKSSNNKIATVDANGKITTKMAGQVTITASAAGKKASCVVTVLYKDVTNAKDFWYAPTNYLTAKGVVKGYDKQTKFKPANDCTRAQMVTFLYRLQGEPKVKSTTCKFSDVKKTDYFYKPVIWANENGITTGISKTKFGPQGVCTRAQTVTFLWRMAKKPEPSAKKNKFPDVKKSDYFYKATLWASEKKILAGLPDGTFNPQGKCLRRQMVTFLYKYDKFINKKS